MKIELSEITIDRFQHFRERNAQKIQNRWLVEAKVDAEKYGVSPLSLYLLWMKNGCTQCFDWPVCKVCGSLLKESQWFKKSQTCSRECNANDPSRISKARSTMKEIYGVETFWDSEVIREKAQQTNLERYGSKIPAKSKIVQDKIRQTNLEKYGYEFPFQNNEVQDKVKQSLTEKYGVSNIYKLPEFVDHRTKVLREGNYENFKQTLLEMFDVSLMMTKEQFVNQDTLILHCNRCGEDYQLPRQVAQTCRCIYCSGKVSEGERQLEQYIRTIYNGSVQHHNKSLSNNREIDIYLPELKIGFEYNGNFFHSTFRKDKFYHQKKTKDALDLGIQLVHIFEYQWINNQDWCKNLVATIINRNYDYDKLDLTDVNWNEIDIRPLLANNYTIESYNELTPHYIVHHKEQSERDFNLLPEITKRNSSIIFDAGTIVLKPAFNHA